MKLRFEFEHNGKEYSVVPSPNETTYIVYKNGGILPEQVMIIADVKQNSDGLFETLSKEDIIEHFLLEVEK